MTGDAVRWGFPVEKAGELFGVGGSTVLVRSVRASANVEIARRVNAFAELADLGGLCGAALDPRSSGLEGHCVRIGRDGVRLAFDRARLDLHAWKVLVNILDDPDLGITGMSFALALPRQAWDLTTPNYPDRWLDLPFTVGDEATLKNTLCEVTFGHSLNGQDAALVWCAVETWACVAGLGGFREWDRPRAQSLASWPENERFDEARLTFEIGFLDCEDAAIACLINLFARLALTVTWIAEFDIS